MRVVYSPVHLGHEIRTQTDHGRPGPGQRGRGARGAHPRRPRADGGFELVGPTEHGEDPITAVHDPGLLAFLRDAWADDAARPASPHGLPRARDDRNVAR